MGISPALMKVDPTVAASGSNAPLRSTSVKLISVAQFAWKLKVSLQEPDEQISGVHTKGLDVAFTSSLPQACRRKSVVVINSNVLMRLVRYDGWRRMLLSSRQRWKTSAN